LFIACFVVELMLSHEHTPRWYFEALMGLFGLLGGFWPLPYVLGGSEVRLSSIILASAATIYFLWVGREKIMYAVTLFEKR
jgi:hypothetical protein